MFFIFQMAIYRSNSINDHQIANRLKVVPSPSPNLNLFFGFSLLIFTFFKWQNLKSDYFIIKKYKKIFFLWNLFSVLSTDIKIKISSLRKKIILLFFLFLHIKLEFKHWKRFLKPEISIIISVIKTESLIINTHLNSRQVFC